MKENISLNTKVFKWLFGEPNRENKYKFTEENHPIIDLVAKSLINFLSKVPENISQAIIPFTILRVFLFTHEDVILILLDKLALHIARFLYTYSDQNLFNFSKEILAKFY